MPTNRSFLPNFLAAFQARSSLQNGAPSKPPAQGGASSTSHSYSTTSTAGSSGSSASSSSARDTSGASSPRPINSTSSSKAGTGATTVAVQQATAGQFHTTRHHHTHHPPSYPRSPQSPPNFPPLGSRGRSARRDSDSSTEGGFKDALGAGVKWYIGGQTAAGDEKFYKLAMAKRPKSADRMSLDRMSL
jgi:hypothetical protein